MTDKCVHIKVANTNEKYKPTNIKSVNKYIRRNIYSVMLTFSYKCNNDTKQSLVLEMTDSQEAMSDIKGC